MDFDINVDMDMKERRLLAKIEWCKNFVQLIGLVFMIGAVLVPATVLVFMLATMTP